MAKNPEKYVKLSQDIRGKNVFITGGTSGIGKETALALGRCGANVYIHGRNREKGEEIVNKLQKDIGTKSDFIRADFSKLQEVRAAYETISDEIDHLDILFNNAGGFFRGEKTGTNNLEYTFVVNHLASFLLTTKLLPLLKESEQTSKIILTSSSAHRTVDNFDFNAIEEPTNNWESYGRSKLANVLFSLFLARKLDDKKVVSTAVHPGVIPGSGFLRNLPGPVGKIGHISNYVPLPGLSTPKQGSASLLNAMKTPPQNSGVYYSKRKAERPATIAQDTKLQTKVQKKSAKYANISFPEDYE